VADFDDEGRKERIESGGSDTGQPKPQCGPAGGQPGSLSIAGEAVSGRAHPLHAAALAFCRVGCSSWFASKSCVRSK
jgi:hypothetical protein